jgi:hypothetical protein
VLLVACSDDGGGVTPIDDPPSEPDDTAPDEPTDAPDETAAEDPFAVPDEITVDYVQSVVDELLPLRDAAERDALETAPHADLPEDLVAASRAGSSPDRSAPFLADLAVALTDPAEAEARLEGRNFEVVWTVTEVLHSEDGCVVFAFDYPDDAFADQGRQVILTGFSDRAPEELNPTPWVLDLGGPVEFDDFTVDALIERCDAEQEFGGAEEPSEEDA